MKRGILLTATLMLLTSTTCIYADKMAPATASACNALSADEQQFSAQLTDAANKTLFCNKFSADQRAAAMQIAGQYDSNGNPMTADLAVQKIAQDNNIVPPPQQKSSGGGCPVK